MSPQAPLGLSPQSLGHLNYLHSVLAQPHGSWDGFFMPQSQSMNFALRYQLAFGAYAVAALAQRTPAFQAPYAEALRGAIEKMIDVASWGYWRSAPTSADGSTPGLASSGHVAVLMSPHASGSPAGPPSDPIARDNLQYSGHLSTMLGLYEKLTGDHTYDNPFNLADPVSGVSYSYTHGDVANRIHEQMRENRFGGVCCESGIAYVPCNNHALASNALHDAVHGSTFSEANARWLRSVRRKMVLRGPALRGIFSACYVKDLGAGAPVAFNFTDAWGLAFMLPFDGRLVRKLYAKFRRRMTNAGSDGAYLGSSALSERLEISDVPINTGFALITAKGVGDAKLVAAIERYSVSAFDARWQEGRYLYRGAPRTLHATALYALASAIEPGGENFTRLFSASPDRAAKTQPFLSQVSSSPGQIGVSRAEYNSGSQTLDIGLRHVGDPSALRDAPPVEASITLHNVMTRPYIAVGGIHLPEEGYSHSENGELRFNVTVNPSREASCAVRLA